MTSKLIVVGTDGSAEALRAVEWAAREASLRSASLRIVSAAELLPRMTMPPETVDIETVATRLSRERDRGLATAASAAAATAPTVPLQTEQLDGPSAEAVIRSGADALMLVVGSRGSGAFAAMTLGSVSRYAAVHASCPVVVVRQESDAPQRQVVVGIRDAQDCEAALTFAFEAAQLRQAALLAVHAMPSRNSPGAEAQAAGELYNLVNDWQGKYPEVAASQRIVRGHPGRVLTDLSASADLVVLGRHGANGGPLPSPARVIHAVVGHAHGPVVTVPSA